MSGELQRGTALLAAVFGTSLLTATVETARSERALDAHQAREFAVLARVLEKRLGEVRRAMTDVAERNALPVHVSFTK